MPGKNKYPLLATHAPHDLAAWVRAEAERRSKAEGRKVTITTIINEALQAAKDKAQS